MPRRSGKAILAALPAKQRDMFLGPEPYTAFSARTIVRRDDLDKDIEVTRARGYAVDDEEAAVQSACIGAEIVGSRWIPDRGHLRVRPHRPAQGPGAPGDRQKHPAIVR